MVYFTVEYKRDNMYFDELVALADKFLAHNNGEYIYNDEYTDLDKLLELSEGERTGRKAELDYKTQNTILKLLKIEEESGNYVYLYDGRYIWSIRRQIFNEHIENKEIQKNYLVMEGNL